MNYINVNNQRFTTLSGASNYAQPAERLQFASGGEFDFEFQLLDTNGNPVSISASDTFDAGADINFSHNDDLLFYADAGDCNIIDGENGIIAIHFNCNTTSFTEKITSLQTIAYLQIRRYPARQTTPETVLLDVIYCNPSVIANENEPTSPVPGQYTNAQIQALVNANHIDSVELELLPAGESGTGSFSDNVLSLQVPAPINIVAQPSAPIVDPNSVTIWIATS